MNFTCITVGDKGLKETWLDFPGFSLFDDDTEGLLFFASALGTVSLEVLVFLSVTLDGFPSSGTSGPLVLITDPIWTLIKQR